MYIVVFFPTQIENIDACLNFLAAKGINIQGLSAEGKSALVIVRNAHLLLMDDMNTVTTGGAGGLFRVFPSGFEVAQCMSCLEDDSFLMTERITPRMHFQPCWPCVQDTEGLRAASLPEELHQTMPILFTRLAIRLIIKPGLICGRENT